VPVRTDVLLLRAVGPSPPGRPGDSVDAMDETPRVLIGYATAAGSTQGIAERIAAVLRDEGCEAVCRPVGPDVDCAGFDALVIGSAVHNMAWLRPAVDLLGRVPDDRPTWCFSVGGVSPHGRLTRYMTGQEVRRVEQAFPSGFRAREHVFFGGVIEMRGLPLWGRIFWRLIGGRPGDQRDWPAIEGWARQIAAALPTRPADGGRQSSGLGTSGTPRPGTGTPG